jgi:hypothetical protein
MEYAVASAQKEWLNPESRSKVRTSSIVVQMAHSANPFCAEEYGAINSCMMLYFWQYSSMLPTHMHGQFAAYESYGPSETQLWL